MKILALFISLTLLVMSHELGHLLSAKACGMRVRRFYVFFNWGFSILKAKKFDGRWHFLFFNVNTPQEWLDKEPDNTLWGLGWLPLGGYCDIAGMIDETKKADDLPAEPQPWEYRSKPAWQRLIVISAGVVVNFLSALLIYTCIFAHWGKVELPLRNADMGYNYCQLLLDEGFRNGDLIVAIDGEEMTDYTATTQKLLLDKPSVVTVQRTESVVADTLLALASGDTSFSQQPATLRDTTYLVDIALSGDLLQMIDKQNPEELMTVRTPFVIRDFSAGSPAKRSGMAIGDSLVSIEHVAFTTVDEAFGLMDQHRGEKVTVGFFRTRSENGRQTPEYMELEVPINESGKLGVYRCSANDFFKTDTTEYTFFAAIPAGVKYGCTQLVTYVKSLRVLFTKDGAQSLGGFGTLGSLFPHEWNWFAFWDITAFLAVILAFMNVIPIPGLDGGHILFTLWEMITRRKPSDKFLSVAETVGMVLLIALLVFANGNDILRAFR